MPLIPALLLLGWVAKHGGDWWWPMDMIRHFPLQLMLAGWLWAPVAAWQRRWRLAGAMLVAGGMHGGPVIAEMVAGVGGAGPGGAGAPLRLMVANVRTENRKYEDFEAMVARYAPDVLVAVEVDRAWVEEIERQGRAGEAWGGRVIGPGPTHFGIAVFAAGGFVGEGEVFRLDRVPAIRARVRAGGAGAEAELLAVHTYRQASGDLAGRQEEQFANLAARARGLAGEAPVILAGDLNSTPWSGGFGRLIAASGLAEARRGYYGSWPSKLPAPWRIPIDHVLVSPEIGSGGIEVSEAFGSDHRAIVADLVIPAR